MLNISQSPSSVKVQPRAIVEGIVEFEGQQTNIANQVYSIYNNIMRDKKFIDDRAAGSNRR